MADAPIYLDHNATTPIAPAVFDAMLPYLRDAFGNQSSNHAYGRAARGAIARARVQLAALLGCGPTEIVFTSGGTEATHLALRGRTPRLGRTLAVTSCIEHPATWAALRSTGLALVELPVDGSGVTQAPHALDDRVELLSVMLAHNETGVLQPITELAAAARAVGAWVHTDAAQAVGKVPVNVDELGVDLLTVAGHKLYAPKGVGALYVRSDTPLTALVGGGGQEEGRRGGTENVAGIVGLGAAAALACRDLEAEAERQRALRDDLHARLIAAVPGLVWSGRGAPTLPGTLHVRFPSVRGADVLAATPQVAASTGSACHDGSTDAAAVLVAMGVPAQEARGAVRLSLGRHTTADQVARAAEALAAGWLRARG